MVSKTLAKFLVYSSYTNNFFCMSIDMTPSHITPPPLKLMRWLEQLILEATFQKFFERLIIYFANDSVPI